MIFHALDTSFGDFGTPSCGFGAAFVGPDPSDRHRRLQALSREIARGEAELARRTPAEWLDAPVCELPLDPFIVAAIERQAIFIIRDLLALSQEDLLSIPYLGQRSVDQVYGACAAVGWGR